MYDVRLSKQPKTLVHNEILPSQMWVAEHKEHVAPLSKDVDVKLLHTLKSILNNILANVFHIVCSRHHNLQTFMCSLLALLIGRKKPFHNFGSSTQTTEGNFAPLFAHLRLLLQNFYLFYALSNGKEPLKEATFKLIFNFYHLEKHFWARFRGWELSRRVGGFAFCSLFACLAVEFVFSVCPTVFTTSTPDNIS